MPNWRYKKTFYFQNKNQLDSMARKFLGIFCGEPTSQNGFGHGWMGDYANKFFPNIGSDDFTYRDTDDILPVRQTDNKGSEDVQINISWDDIFNGVKEE